jgi:hypothetical protein
MLPSDKFGYYKLLAWKELLYENEGTTAICQYFVLNVLATLGFFFFCVCVCVWGGKEICGWAGNTRTIFCQILALEIPSVAAV